MGRTNDQRQVRSALMRYPTTAGRRWLRFDSPVRTITAWSIGEVESALDDAEREADNGRWVVGFVSYDAGVAFEPALGSLRDAAVPLVAFGVFDESAPSRGPAGGAYRTGEWLRSRDRAAYLADLRRVREEIARGATYQVNYTMRLVSPFDGDPLGLFSALSRAQRAEHMVFVDLGDAAICSASPELFLRRTGHSVESRPMKGTRPRHPDAIIDRQYAEDLVRSPKDRAENTMIVDMARNDLGRVADVGSVRVSDLYTVEQYPTVHQLTSTVEARTDVGLTELFAATFPAASITGAPKVRTSQIIAELERTPRGIYTGSIGAIEPGGGLEFNVAIRTAWVDLANGQATYGVGGGIVWDSVPSAEWDEAVDKTRILDRSRAGFRLLETMRYEPEAGVVLLERHLDRLRSSADHFGFDVNLVEIRRQISATRPDDTSVLRLLVGPDGAADIEVQPLPDETTEVWRLPIDSEPVQSDDELLFHKTTRRERYEAARARFPDAPDVILWNEKGEITETTIGNLVLDIDGEYITPPRSSGVLPGTFRAELLEAETITERIVLLDDLDRADSIWMVNSVRGRVPLEVRTEPQIGVR